MAGLITIYVIEFILISVGWAAFVTAVVSLMIIWIGRKKR